MKLGKDGYSWTNLAWKCLRRVYSVVGTGWREEWEAGLDSKWKQTPFLWEPLTKVQHEGQMQAFAMDCDAMYLVMQNS